MKKWLQKKWEKKTAEKSFIEIFQHREKRRLGGKKTRAEIAA